MIVVPDSNSVRKPNKRRRISLIEYKTSPKRLKPRANTPPPHISLQSSFRLVGSFVKAVLKKYGIEEETKTPLPPKWT